MAKENGETFNVADFYEKYQESNVQLASRLNNLFRGFWEGQIPAETTYEFAIDIPQGIYFFGFSRSTEVSGTPVSSTFLTCSGFTSAEGPILGLSFDRRQGKRGNSQGAIHRASSLSDVVVHSPASVIDPAGFFNSDPSTQTEAGIQPAFDYTELPAFRYQNNSGSAATVKLYLFWQEIGSDES
jgi:hypothetical protein